MQHSLLVTTPELDAQLARIQKSIRLSMNGIVAESMQEHGLNYKKNYGVTTLRLKEIARDYTPGIDLAQRLWLLGIRETMILATMLAPASSFPESTAEKWSLACTNQELIEQANMNLFQHLPYADTFALKCIVSENTKLQSFGFTLALRTYKKMSDSAINQVVQQGLLVSTTTDNYLIKTIASCLARFCRIDRMTADIVKNQITQQTEDEHRGLTIIRKFIDNELIFLGYEQDNT